MEGQIEHNSEKERGWIGNGSHNTTQQAILTRLYILGREHDMKMEEMNLYKVPDQAHTRHDRVESIEARHIIHSLV